MSELDASGLDLDNEVAVQEVWDRLGKLSGKDKEVIQRKSFGLLGSVTDGTKEKSRATGSPFQAPALLQTPPLPSLSFAPERHITVESSNKKLKCFSGKTKTPNGEVDYKHWRRAALRVVEDEDISESRKKHILLQSLTDVAEDSIELHRHLRSLELLEVLDKLFGTIVDGSDLLADFYQIFQLPGQTVSEYLNLLYVRLAEVVTLEGLRMSMLPTTLLRQFIRGVSVADETIINKLRLEERLEDPPNFPDLFVVVRREESRRTERRLLHKRLAKSQAVLNSASSIAESGSASPKPATVQPSTDVGAQTLRKEMTKIQQQLSTLLAPGTSVNSVPGQILFCYKCGQDGHKSPACKNSPNRPLVKERLDARRNASGN